MKIILKNTNLELINCKGFKNRLKGLMFQKNFHYALAFEHCNSIHTMFMKVPIDVLMCDKKGKILYIYDSLNPWKIIWPKKKVYSTYELPAGLNTYQVGDIICIETSSQKNSH